MKKLVIWFSMVLAIQANDYGTMAERAINAIKLKSIANNLLVEFGDKDKTYDYRVIDIVKLRGDLSFTILVAVYRDGESTYDLTDILFLSEDEFYKRFIIKK